MSEAARLQAERERIDTIDSELQRLISERASCAARIAKIKGSQVEHFHRPEREAQVLRRIVERNQGPLPDEALARLFRELMSTCLALERPLRVACLGAERSTPLLVAYRFFGHAVQPHWLGSSLEAGLDALIACEFDYLVMPCRMARSEGTLSTLPALLERALPICGELDDGLAAQEGLDTRCWIIGRDWLPPSGVDCTQLLLQLDDCSRGLTDVLHELVGAGIHLRRIESFPTADNRFLLVLSGHCHQAPLDATLQTLRHQGVSLRVLGAHPVGMY